MTDMDATAEAGGKDEKANADERRAVAAVAKALFRAAQEIGSGPLSKEQRKGLSKEDRKSKMDEIWKEQRNTYVREAKKLVRELNITVDASAEPRGGGRKRKAETAGAE
jgi:hypothetical protein